MKEKNKRKEKIALKMKLPNDTMDFHLQGDNEIFSLSKIKTKKVNNCFCYIIIYLFYKKKFIYQIK